MTKKARASEIKFRHIVKLTIIEIKCNTVVEKVLKWARNVKIWPVLEAF